MRGKQAPKRDIRPDPKYTRADVAKLVNAIMRDGKKNTAQKVVYGAFDIIARRRKSSTAHSISSKRKRRRVRSKSSKRR